MPPHASRPAPRLGLVAALLAALFAGCGGDDPSGTGDAGDSGADSANPDAPTVTSGTVHCESSGTGAPSIVAAVVATDPQGPDTIARTGGRFLARNDSSTLMDEAVLICESDGTCRGVVISAMNPGVDCDSAPDLVFSAIVLDEDGNESAAAELAWQGR